MLVSRVLFFLLKTYHHQIASNRVMRSSLIPLRKNLRTRLQHRRDLVAYNLSALKFVKQTSENSAELLGDSNELPTEESMKSLIQNASAQKRKRVKI
jgi:U3 small nucleolar RNA-associated protein 12